MGGLLEWMSANGAWCLSVEDFSFTLSMSALMHDNGGFFPSHAMAGREAEPREARAKKNTGMTSKYRVMRRNFILSP